MSTQERKDWVDPRDLGPAPVDATPRTIGIQLGGNQHRMVRLPIHSCWPFLVTNEHALCLTCEIGAGPHMRLRSLPDVRCSLLFHCLWKCRSGELLAPPAVRAVIRDSSSTNIADAPCTAVLRSDCMCTYAVSSTACIAQNFPTFAALSLSVRVNIQKPIIPKSSQLPAEGRQLFTTSIDDQETIVFEVTRNQGMITAVRPRPC